MALRSRGDRELGWIEKTRLDLMAWARRRLTAEVEIDDRGRRTVFICENRLQAYRALSLWIKEAGTMEWIDRSLSVGDRFLDIGANVGVYTLAAAHRVGAAGRVVAVEPHKPNAVSLIRNVLRNGLQDRVDVMAVALSDRRGVAAFNYTSLEPSVTGSQFGSTRVDASDKRFAPVASELCLGASVDELIEDGAIAPPHLVKIDVDGIELSILRGMARLLSSADRPRSVQVELNVGEHEAVIDFMAKQGYRLDHRHFTLAGERRRAAGVDVAEIAHNAVFAPKQANALRSENV